MSWVEVTRLGSRQQAEELAFTLEAVGIEAQVVTVVEGSNGTSRTVFALLVEERHVEAARKVVAEELESPPSRRGARPASVPVPAVRGTLAFTIGLMLLLCAVFVAEELCGGSERRVTLLRFGASFGPGVLGSGQWWRTVTAAFLHIGPQHLLANLGSLFVLGALSRDRFGPGRLAVLWLASAVAGNWLSLAVAPGAMLRAGASGGIFGLFGALAGARLRQLHAPRPATRFKRWHVAATVLAFLALTVGTGPTDYPAHLGGLAAGALLGLALPPPERLGSHRRDRTLELGLGLLAAAVAVAAGLLALRG
jgi:rhomboid protease GluP